MGTNDEYFASLAQLILATAAAQKAEQDRKDELAFRRQQAAEALALQREGMALNRSESEARMAALGEDRAFLREDRELAKQDREDTKNDEWAASVLAENPDAALSDVVPVSPRAKLMSLEMRSKKAKTEDEIAAAAEAPEERRLRRASLSKASEASDQEMRLRAAQFEEQKALNALQKSIYEGTIKDNAAERERKSYEFLNAVTDRAIVESGGLPASAKAQLRIDALKAEMETKARVAVERAGMIDPMTNKPFLSEEEVAKQIAGIGQATATGVFLETYKDQNPAQAQEFSAELRVMAESLHGAGTAAPEIQRQLLARIDERKKQVAASRPTEPATPPPTVETESKRRLRMKNEAAAGVVEKAIGSADDATVRQLEQLFPNKTPNEVAVAIAPYFDTEMKRLNDRVSVFAKAGEAVGLDDGDARRTNRALVLAANAAAAANKEPMDGFSGTYRYASDGVRTFGEAEPAGDRELSSSFARIRAFSKEAESRRSKPERVAGSVESGRGDSEYDAAIRARKEDDDAKNFVWESATKAIYELKQRGLSSVERTKKIDGMIDGMIEKIDAKQGDRASRDAHGEMQRRNRTKETVAKLQRAVSGLIDSIENASWENETKRQYDPESVGWENETQRQYDPESVSWERATQSEYESRQRRLRGREVGKLLDEIMLRIRVKYGKKIGLKVKPK